MIINAGEDDREDPRPREKRDPAEPRCDEENDKGAPRASGTQAAVEPASSPMAGAQPVESLVVMRSMRQADPLSPEEPPGKRHRSIGHERQEHEQRKPRRPRAAPH